MREEGPISRADCRPCPGQNDVASIVVGTEQIWLRPEHGESGSGRLVSGQERQVVKKSTSFRDIEALSTVVIERRCSINGRGAQGKVYIWQFTSGGPKIRTRTFVGDVRITDLGFLGQPQQRQTERCVVGHEQEPSVEPVCRC